MTSFQDSKSDSENLFLEYFAANPGRCTLIFFVRLYRYIETGRFDNAIRHAFRRNGKYWACLPHFGLHVIRPRLDARHVAMCVLRIGRGHVRMAHLRTRVRMVRVMGGYVLDRRKGRLQLVVPDHLLSPVFP